MRQVWLIRHAESLANAGAATPTPAEIPLTDRGFRQANELGRNLPVRPDKVIVSPYVRSQQTAEPFLQRFESMPVEMLDVQELTYLCTARCRGTTYEQRKPLVREYWERNDPAYCDGGSAESFTEFIGRVDRFVDIAKSSSDVLTCVFTHEQFIKGVIFRVLEERKPTDASLMAGYAAFMNSFKIPNAAVIRMMIDPSAAVSTGSIDDSFVTENA